MICSSRTCTYIPAAISKTWIFVKGIDVLFTTSSRISPNSNRLTWEEDSKYPIKRAIPKPISNCWRRKLPKPLPTTQTPMANTCRSGSEPGKFLVKRRRLPGNGSNKRKKRPPGLRWCEQRVQPPDPPMFYDAYHRIENLNNPTEQKDLLHRGQFVKQTLSPGTGN